MTATDTMTTPPADSTWTEQFAALKARYPKVREPILVALHILSQNPDVNLDDAKAQAALHGTRITAASVSAAQRLLSRQDGGEAAPTPRKGKAPAERRTRRARGMSSKATDPEALIREVADKIRSQGDAEAERLRAAMRKAIEMLTAAIE